VEIRSNLSRTRLGASGGRFTSRRGGDAVAGIRKYCRQHRLGENTFRRWLKFLAGQEAARKLSEYLSEWRREKRHEEREKGLRKRQRQPFEVSTDGRNRAMQTFQAMHVEAMNWS